MEGGGMELGVGRIEITFDDGDITNYLNAYPVLKELGLKAYFFIRKSLILLFCCHSISLML